MAFSFSAANVFREKVWSIQQNSGYQFCYPLQIRVKQLKIFEKILDESPSSLLIVSSSIDTTFS